MFEHYSQLVIDFVRVHHAWAAPIVFVLAFGESLAFISLLVPAWAALVGIGALISASGHVVLDAGLPVTDLVGLAEAAAKWGASITVRRASARGTADLERIARAGRGRVTFDLSA